MKEKYNALPLDDESGGRAFSIELNLDCDIKKVTIIIRLPFNFPDILPKVFVEREAFEIIYPIPHLDSQRVLCTYDENEVFPNADNPEGVIKEVIERARTILERGIKKLNQDDYADEFSAYWDLDTKNDYYSIVSPGEKPESICLYKFKEGSRVGGVFAMSRLHAKIWLENFRKDCEEYKSLRALYLPLKNFFKPPFPKKNKDIYNRLKECDPKSLKVLLEFLGNIERPSYVLFSIPFQQGYFLGAWMHDKPKKYEFVGKRKKIITDVKGFRPGKAPLQLELLKDFSQTPIARIGIIRTDMERLYDRGGNATLPLKGNKISLIGCGSIGSNLADKIVKMGGDNLYLLDHDQLSFDNIARHLCGASYVGEYKTKAIQNQLQKHYPHLKITTFEEDITSTLVENQFFLNDFDLNIVSIGSTAVELRLNHLLKQNIITKPLLFVWVEPYLAAGHALYIQPGKKGCFRCMFDEKMVYRDSVLRNPGQYTKREAGCQTSYVPYGALEIDAFLVELSRFIMKVAQNHVPENNAFTWTGNLRDMRRLKRPLESKWVGAKNYTVSERSIPQKYYCKDCLQSDIQNQ